jgi:hypothetical protein
MAWWKSVDEREEGEAPIEASNRNTWSEAD